MVKLQALVRDREVGSSNLLAPTFVRPNGIETSDESCEYQNPAKAVESPPNFQSLLCSETCEATPPGPEPGPSTDGMSPIGQGGLSFGSGTTRPCDSCR